MVAVFGCSMVIDSAYKVLGFSTISPSWEIIFECGVGFNKLEIVLGCQIVEKFLLRLIGFFTAFGAWEFFGIKFLKVIHIVN